MNHSRWGATATLLKNGKVLIAGGANLDRAIVATAELFDPSTGKFSPTGMMTEARDGHSATLLSDGRVLIAGGEGCDAQYCSETARFRVVEPLSTAEIYNPKTGQFSRTGSTLLARSYHTATLLRDGRVLLVGMSFTEGYDHLASNSAELYDPKSGKFSLTGSALRVESPAAILLPNGKVLITDSNHSDVGELYDPSRVSSQRTS